MHILFVCTGNTCRSAMAEGITRQMANERGLHDLTVSSAGTGASPLPPGVDVPMYGASDGALLVALEEGVDLSGHRARQLTRTLVDEADLVLAMGERHLLRVEEYGGIGKAYLLAAFASGGASARGIEDPFGGDLAAYRATYEDLSHEIGRALDRVAATREQRGPDAA